MVRNYALTKTDTHLHSLMVTMSQKSSLPQADKSVSLVLMPDRRVMMGRASRRRSIARHAATGLR